MTFREQMGPWRICMLTDCYLPSVGGIEHYIYGLAKHLGQLGHHVEVVTHRPVSLADAQGILPPAPENVTVRHLPGFVLQVRGADPFLDPRVVGRIGRFLKANRYDIIHGHSIGSLLVLAGLRAAKRLGIPTCLTKHTLTMRPTRPRFFNRILSIAERHIHNSWADCTIAVSEAAAGELRALRGHGHIVQGGVDCSHWRPDPIARDRVRRSLDYDEEHLVIGTIARMVPAKGWLSLPRIAAQVVNRFPNARFLAIGDGPARATFAQQVAQLGLEGFFTILGFQPWWSTPDYLNAMDIFAFPSYVEACGIALLESLACERASVARRNGGSEGIIADQETGCLVSSEEEFAQRLLLLAGDAALRTRLGKKGRAFVEEKFSWQVLAIRSEVAYAEAIRHCQAHPAGRPAKVKELTASE